jgi:glycosyltransferase involved in cell wall biosynthesis
MTKLSILIPARNEPFLQQTIDDLLFKARGDIEIIVVLDGYKPSLKEDPKVIVIYKENPGGMRAGINSAVEVSTGDYLMKLDAHCLLGEGFDTILINDCQGEWVMVPRRYRLDPENWKIAEDGRSPIDYMFLNQQLHGEEWKERSRDPKYKDIMVDDLMSSQGSVWFMPKSLFHKLDLMDINRWGTFYSEFQEIGIKAWLSGFSAVKIDKNTYYAHWHKDKTFGRGYPLSRHDQDRASSQVNKWFNFGQAWEKQQLPLSWLVEKFWPVPSWPEDRLLWIGGKI